MPQRGCGRGAARDPHAVSVPRGDRGLSPAPGRRGDRGGVEGDFLHPQYKVSLLQNVSQ